MADAAAAVLDYHEGSKHRPDRYAPGPGGLDWANQPDPFREFAGAPRVVLPLAADGLPTSYADLRRGLLPPARPFDREGIGILFELALGISAWKSFGGSRWALRCNPSSGNLHPTEAYLLCPSLHGLPGGVHHYVSRDHVLEQRAFPDDEEGWSGALRGGVIVGLASIHWREAWKYGMRAWRYCQHDCGHAIAAVAYAAAALGWQARALAGVADDVCARLLGLSRDGDFADAEREAPDVLVWIGDPGAAPDLQALAARLGAARWQGRANRLSATHVPWPAIGHVEAATRKMVSETISGPGKLVSETNFPAELVSDTNFEIVSDTNFAGLARRRRSAVDFDGITSISAAAFAAMLRALLPSAAPPWNAWPRQPVVHPALMVHRVDGLEPGLYVLVREPAALESLRGAMRSEWLWRRCGPEGLALYLLLPYDLRAAARLICCHQDIAADSCFALGFLARFALVEREPWRYRELFWETGMLGQVLYLEAEAAGVRATGIGCFFDDEMHRLLGLRGHEWQSLYHFTVGGPIDDPRLTTLPPYPHRGRTPFPA